MLAEHIAAAQLADLSARGAGLAASLAPSDLPRLSGLVAHGGGAESEPLEALIGFGIGSEALPVIWIRVRGFLQLPCQRCLAPLRWPIDVDVSLTAVKSDAMVKELADPFDSVLLDDTGRLPLRIAVEDEILAVLPLAPMHDDPAQCATVVTKSDAAASPAPRDTHRPFADLDSLMGKRDGDEEP